MFQSMESTIYACLYSRRNLLSLSSKLFSSSGLSDSNGTAALIEYSIPGPQNPQNLNANEGEVLIFYNKIYWNVYNVSNFFLISQNICNVTNLKTDCRKWIPAMVHKLCISFTNSVLPVFELFTFRYSLSSFGLQFQLSQK